jgi:adenylate cyclase
VEPSIDEIDAKAALGVANTDTADAQRPDLGGRPAERLGRFLSHADTNGDIDLLRRAWYASGVERKSTNEHEFRAMLVERHSGCSNRWTWIERLDFADDRRQWTAPASREVRVARVLENERSVVDSLTASTQESHMRHRRPL